MQHIRGTVVVANRGLAQLGDELSRSNSRVARPLDQRTRDLENIPNVWFLYSRVTCDDELYINTQCSFWLLRLSRSRVGFSPVRCLLRHFPRQHLHEIVNIPWIPSELTRNDCDNGIRILRIHTSAGLPVTCSHIPLLFTNNFIEQLHWGFSPVPCTVSVCNS